VDEAMGLLERMVENGLAPNTITFNTLITVCAKARPAARVDEAMGLLGRMTESGLVPDAITFTSLITACANAHPAARVDEAMGLLDRMAETGVAPDTVTFTSLIMACANASPAARMDDAMILLDRMVENGFAPNEYTLPALLKCCSRAPRNESTRAEKLFARFIGPVRLNEHVKKQLRFAVSPARADLMCRWAAAERPECLLPMWGVRRHGVAEATIVVVDQQGETTNMM
jgi:pentatricopeptide repeat protein